MEGLYSCIYPYQDLTSVVLPRKGWHGYTSTSPQTTTHGLHIDRDALAGPDPVNISMTGLAMECSELMERYEVDKTLASKIE